jgi:hypothetical protein
MLRLLGLIFLVVISVGMAPWGLVLGGFLCAGWLLAGPLQLHGERFSYGEHSDTNTLSCLNAVRLTSAVYCANCDLISNSPHDECRVCGSHSVISVSRLWQLALAPAATSAAKYKISFTADVRDVPANGLRESTKLIGRLAELGGNVKSLHIQVESVNDPSSNVKAEALKRIPQLVTSEWQQAS